MNQKFVRKMINSVIAVIAVLFVVFHSVPVVSYAADSSSWDNAQYIDQSFKSHLLSEDCIFDESVFGSNSVDSFAYNNVKSSIDNAADPMSHPFYNRFLNCDATNLFDGSIYGYIKWSSSSDDKYPFRIGYYSENEIVMTISNNNGEICRLYSKTELIYETWNWSSDYYSVKNVNDKPTGTSNQSYGYTTSSSLLSDTTYSYYSVSGGSIGSSSQQIYLYNAPFKIFDTVEHAVTYLYTGDETGLLYSPAPPVSYDSGLYLENFKMTVHDSNVYSKYYLSFSYTIPDSVLQNYDINDLQLRIDNYCQWECTETYKYGAGGLNSSKDNLLSTDSSKIDYISLSYNRSGFILYLDDLSSVYELIYNNGKINASSDTSKRYLLGNGSSFSIDGFDISSDTIGVSYDNGLIEVTKSRLSLNIFLEFKGSVMGHEYNGSVDFLNGDNSYMESYTPDASGNYNYNDDYKYSDGYYYTDVGTDSAGNPTYNYYYYDSSGGRSSVDSDGQPIVIDNSGNITQNNNVSIPDTINVNINQPDNGLGNVTIEDDDMSLDTITRTLKEGFGILDDVDTDKKGDGYPAMLSYLYSFLPSDFTIMPLLGIASLTGLALLQRLIFKK